MKVELPNTKMKKWIVRSALILGCTVLVLFVLHFFNRQNDTLASSTVNDSEAIENADPTAKYEDLALLPAMLATIAVVFDKENSGLAYLPAVDTNEDGSKAITENSVFETPHAAYDFFLHSTQSASDTNSYVTDYLSLTVTKHTQNGDVEVTYTDKDADGELDAAYVDGVLVTDSSFYLGAQDEYIAELVVARNYLLRLKAS